MTTSQHPAVLVPGLKRLLKGSWEQKRWFVLAVLGATAFAACSRSRPPRSSAGSPSTSSSPPSPAARSPPRSSSAGERRSSASPSPAP
ncbi:hypothetical protein [Brachybacterium sp. GPGPB12]|uniref:hypothetical protein n=1 Tax=Brachybacterium sp. GPGPB12 TaxID=3023517 RepID=UPI00313461D2